jgi:cyclophilin family peptidyl-prolyl cis-trans isomerase/catechol 2,3-dioxygenase-like lactoylglutathione lyase family enzyme
MNVLKTPGCVFVFLAGLLALAPPAAAQPKPLVVLAEASLVDGVLYDAWVEFKDKGRPSPDERRKIQAALEKEFDPRALARRRAKRTFPGLFDERDEPLASAYLRGVEATGARIQVQSRWLNGVTVIADKAQVEKIKALPYVKTVADFHLRKPRSQAPALTLAPVKNPPPTSIYGLSGPQIGRLNLAPLHAAGYTGRGIRVAVVDCGFAFDSEAFRHPEHPLRVFAQRDFVENDDDVSPKPGLHPTNYEHGTMVLGTIAAYAPGLVVGSAYDAEVILCNSEDGDEEYYLEERWFVAGLEYAEARGADVATSSLVLYSGYKPDQADGKTSVMTRGFDIASGNGVICFTGAGNDGQNPDPRVATLIPPGDAAEVITVGAVGVDGKVASFSSDGPTADGRLKPEVLSQGMRTATVSPYNPRTFAFASGTSMATPILAGAGACLLQVHPDWTVRDFRKALFDSGDFFRREGRPDPSFVHGYGVPDVFLAAGMKAEVCVMETDAGTMVFEFFEADAPKTTAQFKDLVRKGFYDGRDFYRVVRGHVIQTGGGGAPKLPPEFNARPHVFGTLGLGRTGDEASGDSEIYVCVAARPYLDGRYTVFGRLVKGFDVLERIAAVPVEEKWEGADKRMAMHKPIKPVLIKRAKIETREAGAEAGTGFPLIRGIVVRYFYRDPAAAERFYGQTLGLVPAGPGLFRVSETTYLRVAPLAEAGQDAGSPKTATLSFVTDEVDGWFDYLKSKGVTFRSELKDASRHPIRGFVALDPEGHLLEFERFLDHPQNSRLNDALRAVKPLFPPPDGPPSRPGELGTKANILWLYYKDILTAQGFAVDKLSAGLLVDQGFAKVMTASRTGFVGLVDGAQGLHPFTERKAVRVDFVVDDPAEWAKVLARRGVALAPSEGTTGPPAFSDPGGYVFRFVPARTLSGEATK